MARSKQPRFAEIEIDRFSPKGNGLGQLKQANSTSTNAEISFAIPGDLIRAALMKKRKKAVGKIEEIIKPSQDRISPKCVHFGMCGGCRWQQMSYSTQLKYKETFIRDLFTPILPSGVEIRPIVGCDSDWNYRNKMEFTFSSDINQNKYLGLIMDSTKGKVLNLSECHLVSPWFINVVKATKSWWEETHLDAYHMVRNSGSLRYLTIREGIKTGDRMVILTVSGNPEFALKQNQLDSFVAAVRHALEPFPNNGKLSIFLRIQQIAKGVATNFFEMLLYGSEYINEILDIQLEPGKPPTNFNFIISPFSFFQPNSLLTEKFYSVALQLSGINKNSVVYDLFCGTGTLGICASKIAKKVVGVEISPEAASDARENAILNDCQNISIISGAVRHALEPIELKELPKADVAFIDPPRSGLDSRSLQNVVQLDPSTIVSISCNPRTQVINLVELMNSGYTIKAIQPFDQFPQTSHIENVAILTKK